MNSLIVSKFISSLNFEDLPEDAVNKVKKCFLDFIGTALASENLPAYECGRKLLSGFGQSKKFTIVGSGEKVPLISAVWANSILGSIMDFEDGYYLSIGHPASVVFPVTLAFAESVASPHAPTAKSYTVSSPPTGGASSAGGGCIVGPGGPELADDSPFSGQRGGPERSRYSRRIANAPPMKITAHTNDSNNSGDRNSNMVVRSR